MVQWVCLADESGMKGRLYHRDKMCKELDRCVLEVPLFLIELTSGIAGLFILSYT